MKINAALKRKLGRLTRDEELALSLGYKHTDWPKKNGREYAGFPRGVWKHPKTGHLHTAAVVALAQKPVDPNGKPFALGASLSELNRLEKLALKTEAELEATAIEKERAEKRRLAKEKMLLA